HLNPEVESGWPVRKLSSSSLQVRHLSAACRYLVRQQDCIATKVRSDSHPSVSARGHSTGGGHDRSSRHSDGSLAHSKVRWQTTVPSRAIEVPNGIGLPPCSSSCSCK